MSELEKDKKIFKKTKLGTKRVLSKAKKESQEIKEEIIIVGTNINKDEKDNSASFLLKLILKAFYLSVWKKKVKALKYYSRKTNKQRMNFKRFINEISLVINQQKSFYFNELIEKTDKLPLPKGFKHDKNFGTLKIVNKEFFNNKKNSKKSTNQKYIKENNTNKEIIIDDGSKEMDLNNDDFNENEYNTYENIENDNYNNNPNIIGNENDIEEDEAFIENEYDYNQELLNDENYNYNNEYYPEDNNYYVNNNPYENENEEYYNENELYDNEIYVPNNNQNPYYENQYHYYYNAPNGYTEERYIEPLNKVNYIKTTGNNILISDVYVKPQINKNQNQYYYNKNNYNYYQAEPNIFKGNMNNNYKNKRAFPFSSHNYSFYASK